MDVVSHEPAWPPKWRAPRPARLDRLVAAAAALVLVAGAVALSVRIDAVSEQRLRAIGPHLDVAMAERGLKPLPEPPFTRRPCRVNDLVGAVQARSLLRTYSNVLGTSAPLDARLQADVAVYLTGSSERRLRAVERGLRRCGGFDSEVNDVPLRVTVSDVVRDGVTLRWRLTYRIDGSARYGQARLSIVGPYLVYVSDLRLSGEPPPGALDDLVRAVAAVVRGTDGRAAGNPLATARGRD